MAAHRVGKGKPVSFLPSGDRAAARNWLVASMARHPPSTPPFVLTTRRRSLLLLALVLPLPVAAQRPLARRADSATTESLPDSAIYHAYQYRLIGPFRGGRANAVSGVASQPFVYYVGYTGGGVWKTEDAGASWKPIADGQIRVGSIGAIAVASSDANVVYVGTGEFAVRGQSSSYGDGVYKSTDAGKTWSRIGLENTRQISRILVHPNDPNIVYVAAQGDRWKPTPDRGVYRSTDGGKMWTKVLAGVNGTSGPSELAMDPSNPRILYAAMWDEQRVPWQVRSGGPGSGIWKSADGGDTWTRLAEGLPNVMGKIGVAVSAANPERVYAIVEADKGGLYRSDDAGKTWQLLSQDRRIQTRAWYYTNVTADPQNADVVYVMNAPIMKSIDGGKTFATLAAPHGDNHQLWINPTDARLIINANDGGATISINGGKSWSTQDNQPTAQFYHMTVDDVYPYRLYSGQQDNSSVIIKSRSDAPAIGPRDWIEGPGCESANVGVDVTRARYVYGGCYVGILEEMDMETGLVRTIYPWPELDLTEPTNETRYRFNWTSPALVSQHDPDVVYFGGNVLFKTTDRGAHWAPISADLTRNDKATQGKGGVPLTNEGAGGEVYGTIVDIVESLHDANTLYVCTDDGLVQLTRDGGKTWANVTPREVPAGLANKLEISPADPATVYLAFRLDRHGDYTPYAFKSTDYGKTWIRITSGLRAGEPVRVIREDPERRGMLFAGTETGLYLSYDDGAHWQPFQRNLPAVPVTDLKIRHGDLYVATEGRAFWALDDLSALRQMTPQTMAANVHLFAPRPALLAGGPSGPTSTAGRNPPLGANFHYWLRSRTDSSLPLKLEVLDSSGRVLRAYGRGTTDSTALKPVAGLNAFQWDLRADPPTKLPGDIAIWGTATGYRVSPGRYQVRLTVGATAETQPFQVLRDPRVPAQPGAIVAARDSLARAIDARIGEIHDDVLRLRDVRTQVQSIVEHTRTLPAAATIGEHGKAIVATIDSIEPKLSTKAANGQDIINYRNGINSQYAYLLTDVEGNEVLSQPARDRFAELERLWSALRSRVDVVELQQVPAFNKLLQDAQLAGVIIPRKQAKTVM